MKKTLYLLLFICINWPIRAQMMAIPNEPYLFLWGDFWEAEPGKPEVAKHKICTMEVTEYQIKNKKVVEPKIVHQLWFDPDALPTEAIFYEYDTDIEGSYPKKNRTTFLYTADGHIRRAITTEHERKDSSRSELNYFYAADGKAMHLTDQTDKVYYDEEQQTFKNLSRHLYRVNFIYQKDTVRQITRSTEGENSRAYYDTLNPNVPFDSLFVLPQDTINKRIVDSLGRLVELYDYEPENPNIYRYGPMHGPYKLAYIRRYTYNEQNLIVSIKIYDHKEKLLTTREYIYDEKGLLAESHHKVYGKESVVRYTYTYYTD